MAIIFPYATSIATTRIHSAIPSIQVSARGGIGIQHTASREDELLRGDGNIAGPQTNARIRARSSLQSAGEGSLQRRRAADERHRLGPAQPCRHREKPLPSARHSSITALNLVIAVIKSQDSPVSILVQLQTNETAGYKVVINSV